MILLLLEGTYPWYLGGVSEWVHQYLSEFSDYNFRILQVATDEYLKRDIQETLYDIPDNVRDFVRIPPPDLYEDWSKESFKWLESNRDKIQSVLNDINIIHVTNTGFAGWLGSVLSAEMNEPLVLTEHAIYWKEIELGAVALECGYKIPKQEIQKQRYVELFQKMAKEIYRKASVNISVSKCNTDKEYSLGVAYKAYIPNGVDNQFFTDKDRTATSEKLTIGWIGRCTNMKNPLRFFSLVDAFRNIPDTHVSFKMLLCDAGENKLKQQIIERSSKYPEVRIIWNQSTIDYIHDMDAVCITSYNESQPLVLFEAIANKSLPFGWTAGDANKEYGLFVNQDVAPFNLATQLTGLWHSKNKWTQKVNGYYESVKKNHTWNNVFSQYREIFQSIHN